MINEAGITLLKEFEGLKFEAYLDEIACPPVWTIGYGDTGPDVREGTVWTKEQCEARLQARLTEFAEEVLDACIEVPNANQLAAMTCLAYNIGLGWERKKRPGDKDGFRQSTVLRMHNQGKFAEAGAAFSMWNKAGGRVRAGLTRRRAAEAALYLTPVAAHAMQTTRATPDRAKDPSTSTVDPTKIAAAAGVALTGAQQAVGQISGIWDTLSGMGISPHVLMGAFGVLAVASLAYFLYEGWQRRKEGDR